MLADFKRHSEFTLPLHKRGVAFQPPNRVEGNKVAMFIPAMLFLHNEQNWTKWTEKARVSRIRTENVQYGKIYVSKSHKHLTYYGNDFRSAFNFEEGGFVQGM